MFTFFNRKERFFFNICHFSLNTKKSDGKETPQPNLRFLFIVTFRFFLASLELEKKYILAIASQLYFFSSNKQDLLHMKKSQKTINKNSDMVENFYRHQDLIKIPQNITLFVRRKKWKWVSNSFISIFS